MDETRNTYLSRATGQVRKRRSDGWTQQDIETFLAHLRMTGNIESSAAAIGKSGDAAHNLRNVDPAFEAQVIAARAEMRARLESKIALFAETGGVLPPLGEDGVPTEVSLEHFNPQLAMDWLKFLDAKEQTRGRRGGPRPKSVSKDALIATLMKLYDMLERRLATRAAG